MTGHIVSDFVTVTLVIVIGTIPAMPLFIAFLSPVFILLKGIQWLLGGRGGQHPMF